MDNSANQIRDEAVNSTLKILRDQRDTKQHLERRGRYVVNPQIFKAGCHYVTEPIEFGVPFQRKPVITFGCQSEKDIAQITGKELGISGYVPFLVMPYVYGWGQTAGMISSFYIGLYLITSVPASITSYTVDWHAIGKASAYAQHRIDEAWTSAYDRNQATYLQNQTGGADSQS